MNRYKMGRIIKELIEDPTALPHFQNHPLLLQMLRLAGSSESEDLHAPPSTPQTSKREETIEFCSLCCPELVGMLLQSHKTKCGCGSIGSSTHEPSLLFSKSCCQSNKNNFPFPPKKVRFIIVLLPVFFDFE